jgi:anthranilate synthase component 2
MAMTKRLLIIDNYDSFTYNLVQLLAQCDVKDFIIRRNDNISFAEASEYDSFLLSPGPGIPSEAGSLCDFIKHFAPSKKILGICLGHQAIAECFGGKLIQMDDIMHGIASEINILPIQNNYIFNNLPNQFIVGRYHSWVVSNKQLPEDLIITAVDQQQHIMAIKHRHLDLIGLQFHPESYISQHGTEIMRNWLKK